MFDIFNYLDSMQSFLRYVSQANVQLKEYQFIGSIDVGEEIEAIRKIVLEYIIPNGDVFHSFENQVILINPNKMPELVQLFTDMDSIHKQIIREHEQVFDDL